MTSRQIDELNIIGCGGHARSVSDVVLSINPKCDIRFFDDNAIVDEKLFPKYGDGYSVYNIKDINSFKEYNYHIAVGNNKKRCKLYNELNNDNYSLISVLSANACISERTTIEDGVFVGNLVNIGPEAIIRKGAIINTFADVEHECVIGKFAHISIGAKIGGRSLIGDRSFIGAGATVIDKIQVCNDVIVGAGAVVVKDICETGVYVGIPARRIK